MSHVIDIDAATGDTTVRDYTPEEQAQREADALAIAAIESTEIEAAQARADAIAHAKSLGFTDAMIAVMYPGLAQ